MNSIIWFLSYLKPYLLFLILSILGSALQSAGAAGVTFLVKRIVDEVFILKNQEELLRVSLFLLGSALLMQVGFFLSTYFTNFVAEKVIKKVRGEIYENILKASLSFFIQHKSGELISRIVNDTTAFKQVLSDYVPKLMREPLVGIVLFGVLLYRDLTLTLLLFFLLPIMAYMVKFFGRKKGKYMKLSQEKVAELTQVISQTVYGIESIKLFLAEAKFSKAFAEFNEKLFRFSMKSVLYMTTNTVLNYMFGYTVVALVLLYGGFRIVRGDMSTGDFISYLTALFMIQMPIMESQKALMNLRSSVPVIDRIRYLLDIPKERSGVREFKGLKEGIRVKDLRVSIGESEILKGISLDISKGSKLGIVGRTGSGKSSLIRVIPGLLEYEGSVLVDGVELREIRLETLRERIGFSSQEVILFRDTIRNNLLLAKPDATEKEIRGALSLAMCNFVYTLPQGIDTEIGERGTTLSGGERQRLALARIFLKNPDIVVLDEATSALDMDTEEKVLKNVFEFFKDKTVIVVAHRISNVKFCDEVVVMKEGKIVERGSIEELSALKGEFYSIFKESHGLS